MKQETMIFETWWFMIDTLDLTRIYLNNEWLSSISSRKEIFMPRKSKEDAEGSIFETKDYYLYAAELIYRYLGDRSYFIGGAIPKCKLLSIQSVQIVLRTDLDFAVQHIHNHCIPHLVPTKDYNEPSVPWEVDYVLRMLYELGDLEVPKRFRGGLMLLYFKFCQGHAIPDPPEIVFDEHSIDSSEIMFDEYSVMEECYEILN